MSFICRPLCSAVCATLHLAYCDAAGGGRQPPHLLTLYKWEIVSGDLGGHYTSIQAEAGLALSLIIHELATNATKYGALSSDTGTVDISWTRDNGRVSFIWHEQGGPPVSKPHRAGFGPQLIRRAIPGSDQPELMIDYAPDGLRCVIAFQERHIAAPTSR